MPNIANKNCSFVKKLLANVIQLSVVADHGSFFLENIVSKNGEVIKKQTLYVQMRIVAND